MFFIFSPQRFTFSPAKLSIFNPFLFENSFAVLIALAENPEHLSIIQLGFFYLKLEKRIFCDFSANIAFYWG